MTRVDQEPTPDETSGAIDSDFDDAALPYEERLANALADIRTEPVPGSLAIDIVSRQLLFRPSRCRRHARRVPRRRGLRPRDVRPTPVAARPRER